METIVEKCGICADPPAFVVVYRTPEKLRRKVMPLRNFTSTTDVDWFIQKLKEKHNFDKVPLVKVKKMLRLVQELQKGVSLAEAVSKLDKQFELKINEDLNKLPTEELEIQKQLMEALFLKNQIKKDDSDFVYDKRLDFPGEKTESNWDSETDDKFWI